MIYKINLEINYLIIIMEYIKRVKDVSNKKKVVNKVLKNKKLKYIYICLWPFL